MRYYEWWTYNIQRQSCVCSLVVLPSDSLIISSVDSSEGHFTIQLNCTVFDEATTEALINAPKWSNSRGCWAMITIRSPTWPWGERAKKTTSWIRLISIGSGRKKNLDCTASIRRPEPVPYNKSDDNRNGTVSLTFCHVLPLLLSLGLNFVSTDSCVGDLE